MHFLKKPGSTFIIFLFMASMGFAQEDEKKKWDVTEPPGPFEELNLSTSEGTWMNLDVSPDGSEVVFDLLGDIFILPIDGGEARALRTGHAFEVQPRFSPDGSRISFTSDAGGGDNIWVMDRNGENARQVTKESFRLLNNAVWTPDGRYLIARKHFTSGRSLGAGELWMYHVSGGTGIQLTERKNDQQDLGEPWVGPDGKHVYFSEDMYPGGFFQYNKDPNSRIYVIKRYSFVDGKTETVTGGPGGAFRPQISPDGTRLAFVRRVRTKSVLFLRNLATGEEWPVYDNLSKDQQEAWAIFGVYTNFNWLPDNQHIVVWAKGKIHKINVSSLEDSAIPFNASAMHKITEAIKQKNAVFSESFRVKAVRDAVTSPNGKMLVFKATGHLYKKELPNGKPLRLTTLNQLESEPSFSRDGSKLAFVTWSDVDKGAIWTLDLNTRRAAPTKITAEKGLYRSPSWSPNGGSIVFWKENGNGEQGFTFTENPGIYTIPANGGAAKLITKEGSFPEYSADGQRIFFQDGGVFFGNLTKTLMSVDLDGNDKKEHVKSKYGNRLKVSPDNQWVAFSNLFKLYVAPMPMAGQTLDLDGSSKSVPVTQIAKDAGYNTHWSSNSQQLMWTLGEKYFSASLRDHFDFLRSDGEEKSAEDSVGISIDLELTSDKPTGRVAFTNARIITMKGDEIIEKGTIVINANKIEALGDSESIEVPGDALVMDVSGHTIIPGIVDAHAHVGAFRYGLSAQQKWQYFANLAFGVTTSHDPSANTETVFSDSEKIKAGEMVGQRLFSTGIILYGADGDFKAVINNLDDAKSALRRTQAFGAFSVKSYNQPRREQRQQVIAAARELGMHVYPEGGSTFFHNLTMILDGHTGIEHNLPVYPLYKDVLELFGKSGTGYTPTLVVNYGSVSGEYYWYQTQNIWENERLLTFTPRSVIDSRSRHRTMIPMEEYKMGHIMSSAACKALTDAGVKVNLGAHGQMQGLGAHWELWMFVQGGMSNHEALKVATINGAAYLGMDEEIGSLEVGKLADLVVLEANPLDDIQNSEKVKYTMINGRLFDAETMNEIGTRKKDRLPFYWEQSKYNQAFPWHEDTGSFGFLSVGCGCGRH